MGEKIGRDDEGRQDFIAQAREKSPGLMREFWDYLRVRKKWWLAPLVVALLVLALVVLASSSAIAPFIYTLF